MPYGWQNQGMGGGTWALMIIGMLVFGAILVVGLVALSRHNHVGHNPSTSPTVSDPAIPILKERFARGEMTEEEYTRRLAILKDHS
jgi:putative membrane protein